MIRHWETFPPAHSDTMRFNSPRRVLSCSMRWLTVRRCLLASSSMASHDRSGSCDNDNSSRMAVEPEAELAAVADEHQPF